MIEEPVKIEYKGGDPLDNYRFIGENIPIESVMEKIIAYSKSEKFLFPGCDVPVNVKSLRLNVFKRYGTDCEKCGAKGSHFRIGSSGQVDNYHLCLIAVNPEGREVLMTKDHVVPKSKGGPDRIENMQPMCAICNFEKSNL